jgi:hypothetical protein
MGKNVFEEVSRDKAQFIPKKGFRLVGVDSFAMPGEAVYDMGIFATRAEAEAKMAKVRERNERIGAITDKMYVYGPNDR